MSGFTPWRRGVVPFPPAPVDELAQTRTQLQKVRNERNALAQQLRDMARRIREQDGQIEAAAKMLAGAKRECAERCEHAQQLAAAKRECAERCEHAQQLAAAKRECAERCEHAQQLAAANVTLHRMQLAADENAAADVARDRAALRAASPAVWTPRRPSGERA